MRAACTKQDEKAVKEEPKKATPVTSADLGAFNDFVPATGGAGGLAVKLDGGGEAGLPPGVPAGAGSGTAAGGAEPGGGGGSGAARGSSRWGVPPDDTARSVSASFTASAYLR
jgi:hypothetical protein